MGKIDRKYGLRYGSETTSFANSSDAHVFGVGSAEKADMHLPKTPSLPTDQDLQLDNLYRRDAETDMESNFPTIADESSTTCEADIPSHSQCEPEGIGSYPPPLPDRSLYVIDFDGPDDPAFPQNWHWMTKLYISILLAFTCISSTFDSAVFSPSIGQVSKYFGVSEEVATLASSLYIVGYACGPLIWAPLSELYGRRLPIILAMLGFGIFNTAVAVSKDLQTLMICRYFGGVFGSSPLINVAAVFADMYNNRTRGIAIALFANTVFLGPLMAPCIGGFINESYLGWRWTAYVPAFMGYSAFLLNTLFLKESYAPVVLVSKAVDLRRRTKNWGIHAKQEQIEINFRELVVNHLARPLQMLFKEPLILAVTVYLSFIYGLLYCFLSAYTSIFQGVYGMSPGVGGLPLFGVVGGLVAGTIYMIFVSRQYNIKLEANANRPIPEWRLPSVIVGGVLFSVGLFWLGWTGFTSSIHWIAPTLSGLFTGAGLLIIFIQLFNYLIDTYLAFAASALAANTFARSLVAAGFPLFSRQMFANMGIQWAGTLLGCLAAALVPIPIIFLIYGRRLRAKSQFAPMMEGS
ncbi:MFS general substrate transporter [Penicillium sp. CMV-2018d]|nr:MFS general substrate transporter [Penicillium sp. CMV-2018d]